MKISIIIPTYNSEKFILDAVRSALNQGYVDKEVIVVNDGSTDQTKQKLNSYLQSGQIIYLEQSQLGPGAARNKGVEVSQGEIIAFLDADDIFLPKKLEKQIQLFKDSKIGLTYTDMEFFGSRFGYSNFSEIAILHRGKVFTKLLENNFISTSTTMIRKDIFNKAGGFDESLKIAEDYDLWLRASRLCQVDYIEDPLTRYRIHKSQTSKSARKTYDQLQIVYKKILAMDGISEDEKAVAKSQLRQAKWKKLFRTIIPRHSMGG